MVTRADKFFERFSLSRHGAMAIPISIFESSGGTVTYEVYKKLMRKIRSFEKSAADPFSDEGILHLREIADGYMKKYMYTATDRCEILLEYKADFPLPDSSVCTVILKTNAEISAYGADTTLWNLEVDDEDVRDVICAVIENGRIAAYACVNDIADDDGLEITVECAPAYRCRGYASSCAVGITNYLIKEASASAVHYKCRSTNIASRKCAEKAGFTYTGRSLTLVYER